ncbi:hypothetical protein N1689_20915 [Pantoea sp. XY16]|uniref:hypothetical protein n=1 Tax=Pantoea sp. XY16 TaxID=2976705 RepID=UPI0021A940AD|nr:hypothetical protein [Pantoea sp. XY16]MCT2420315.1 hypothetical protein [Pantoea sp. XY16]
MRSKKREQVLIQLITLLDNARLGERKETILNLLHSARRAIREREVFNAQQHTTEALGQLRKARHSLRVSGANEQEITVLENAVVMLLPVQDEADADSYAYFIVCSLEFRYLLLFLIFAAGLAVAFVRSTGQLPGF